MIFFLSLVLFGIGASIGSFVNVLVDRTKIRQSIFKKRSYCDFCKEKIAWYDLIPIVSFLLLLGKCRNCGHKISLQYPIVETASGFLTLGVFLQQAQAVSWNLTRIDWLTLIYLIIVFNLLVAIFLSDLKYGLIFDRVILWGVVASFSYILIKYFGSLLNTYLYLSNPENVFGKYLLTSGYFSNKVIFELIPIGLSLLAAFLAGLSFLLLVVMTKGRGMGGGDIKLVFWLGLAIGIPKILVTIFLAFLGGAIWAIFLLLIGFKKFGQTIPFGPFLVLSAAITLIFGDWILNFYLKQLGFALFQ